MKEIALDVITAMMMTGFATIMSLWIIILGT